MENMTYHLEGVIKSEADYRDFEGPLNLILMLLSKNKIEIRDIQISLILNQYLEQIEQMQAMDLEIASEFIQMASHLLYLKTRTLLAGQDDEVSELDALISSLEQLRCRDAYVSIKKITAEFDRAAGQGLLLMSRPPEPLPKQQYRYQHDPVELLAAFASMLSRGGQNPDTAEPQRLMPKRIVYGVRTKSMEIVSRLRELGSITLHTLFAASKSRSELVATFISVLELCAGGGLHISVSEEQFVLTLTETKNAESIIENMEIRDEGDKQDGAS